MNSKRMQYGRCRFILPDGFVIKHEASHLPPHSSSCAQGGNLRKTPIYLTLSSTRVHSDVPDFSESSEDLRPDAFPSSIVLTTSKSMIHGRPIEHLRKTEEVLQRYFKNFKIDFCERDRIGEFKAAKAQSSFATNFRLFRLNFAWLADRELVISTMMVSEPGVSEGWIDHRRFVESLSL